MDITHIINELLPIAAQVAPSQVPALERLRQGQAKQGITIAVLGDFKAGKSTLLNALFLGRPLLPVEYTECTAIPTLISAGAPCLQTWLRDADGNARPISTDYDVSPEKLAQAVTAGDDAGRAALAGRCSYATLTLPDILPDGVTLIDTPGLDTTNTALTVATMWAAHEADAVIYVVRGKTLTRRELDLIAEISGSRRCKIPFFVVVTSDGNQSPAMLESLCTEISAALRSRGITAETGTMLLGDARKQIKSQPEQGGKRIRDYAQVLSGVVAPSPFSFLKGEYLARAGQFMQSIVDKFSAAPDMAALAALRNRLLEFFQQIVIDGRQARCTRELAGILAAVRNAAALRLGMAESDAEERKQRAATRREQEQEYKRTVESLLADVAAAQAHFLLREKEALARVQEKLEARLDSKEQAGDILAEIKVWETSIPHEVKMELNAELITLEQDLRALRERYHLMLERSMVVDAATVPEYEAGFISSVPSWLLVVVDYALFDLVSPLPFFMDVGIRFVIGRLGLEKYMPAAMVATLARKVAKDKLATAMQQVADQMDKSTRDKFTAMNTALGDGLVQQSPFADAGENLDGTSETSVESLSAMVRKLDAWEKELS